MIRTLLGMMTLLVSACFAAGQGEGKAQSKEKKALVQKVFDAWAERRTKVKSVRYKVSGKTTIIKGSLGPGQDDTGKLVGPNLPDRDLSFAKTVTMLLDFGEQRYRYDRAEKVYHSPSKSLQDRVTTRSFTGKEHWTVAPRPANGLAVGDFDAEIVTGNLNEMGFTAEEWPLFISHGFVPGLHSHIVPGRFTPKVEEEEFYYHGSAIHAGRTCTVIRTELDHITGRSFDEYWVDMPRGGAVLRQLAYVNGAAGWDLDMKYEDTPVGWLVAGWTTSYRPAGSTARIFEMRVSERELDPEVAPVDFQVPLEPGMKVKRINRGGNPDSIIVPTSESEQEFVVDNSGKLRQTGGTPISKSYYWWVIGGGVAVVLLVLAWLVRGRRKAASIS